MISGRYYRGNPKLRSAYTKQQYTLEQVQEISKCSKNPIYFLEKYFKITHPDHGIIPFDMYNFQKDIIELCSEERFVIAKTGRQMGKCSCINTIVRVKNKSSGIIEEITIGELHERIKSKEMSKLPGGS